MLKYITQILVIAIIACTSIFFGVKYYLDNSSDEEQVVDTKGDDKDDKGIAELFSTPDKSTKEYAEKTEPKESEVSFLEIFDADAHAAEIAQTSTPCKGGKMNIDNIGNVKDISVSGRMVAILTEESSEYGVIRKIQVIDFCDNRVVTSIGARKEYKW